MHTTNQEVQIMSMASEYKIQNKIHTANQEVHMMSIESAIYKPLGLHFKLFSDNDG